MIKFYLKLQFGRQIKVKHMQMTVDSLLDPFVLEGLSKLFMLLMKSYGYLSLLRKSYSEYGQVFC